MKKFILFYKGPATPPGDSHGKWPAWFNKVGENLVDSGSPLQNGLVPHGDGSTSDSATNFNGYGIVQAQDRNAVPNLVKARPFLAVGKDEYSIEILELPQQQDAMFTFWMAPVWPNHLIPGTYNDKP